jgi:hypothetical protein
MEISYDRSYSIAKICMKLGLIAAVCCGAVGLLHFHQPWYMAIWYTLGGWVLFWLVFILAVMMIVGIMSLLKGKWEKPTDIPRGGC